MYIVLVWQIIERRRRITGVKEGRSGRRERERPKEMPRDIEETWRISWGGEGRRMRGMRMVVVTKREQMKMVGG